MKVFRRLRALPWRVVLPSLLAGGLLSVGVLMALGSAGVGNNKEEGTYFSRAVVEMPPAAMPTAAATMPAGEMEVGGAARQLSTIPQSQETRLIVYNADVTLVVRDTQAALEQIESLGDELGGYVSSSNVYEYAEGSRVSVVLRVPADKLDTAMSRLRAMALEVRRESLSGQDVTEEYVDLNARLKILQAAEQELLELYQTRRAEGDVEDILEVYRQLVSFRQEIESLTGRMQYLEQAAAMATVAVTLIPDALAQPVEFGGWRPEGTIREAFRALIHILQMLADAVIWLLVTIVPLAVIVGGPIYGVWLWVCRRRGRRTGREAAGPAEIHHQE